MIYLKVIWRNDAKSLYPAKQIHWDGESPDVTFVEAPDSGGGTGSFYRGDFLAIFVQGESGKTQETIRGFTDEEARACPRIDDPAGDGDAAILDPADDAGIPPDHYIVEDLDGERVVKNPSV